jgi:GNAT superfamily N-acetyltransferase
MIEPLSSHPEAVPSLAARLVDAFGHLHPAWDVAAATAELRACAAWVAVDRGNVLGTVSLLDDDELEGFRARGPWLASLYVLPEARRRGVGRALVAHVEAEARRRGVARLYLFTEDAADWYSSMGWRTIAHGTQHGHPITVMAKDPNPTAPRWTVVST